VTDSAAEQFAPVLDGNTSPYSVYRRLRSEQPIFWSEVTGGWVASRHHDVKRVLTEEETFGPLGYGAGSSAIHGRVILHMEGREHRKKSGLLGHRLRSPRLIEEVYRPLAERLSTGYLDRIDRSGPVDLKAAFTTPLPLQVTADIMGLPDAPQFREWYDTIVAAGASNLRGDPEVLRKGQQARAALAQWLAPVIRQRRSEPGDDLLSDLCTFEFDGEPLPEDEVLGFCSFLLAAGVETTDRALSNLLRLLVDHPELWDRLRTDRDLVLAACAEILRHSPPVHAISRGARVDTDIAGQDVRAGDRILVLLASANRDEECFDQPEEYEIDRFLDDAPKQFTPRADILPFGAGRHHCTGSLLAQMEMVVAMNHLLDRFTRIEWAGDRPDEVGYVLRSPRSLPVTLA
jgi:cytochrome P450